MTRTCLLFLLIMHTLTWLAPAGLAQSSLIGRKSCGTATCHGGVIPLDPRDANPNQPTWNRSLSIWQAQDRHAEAGNLLLSDRSRRMVLALHPQSNFTLENDGLPQTSHESYRYVLTERCVSCHATVSAEELVDPIETNILARGVSCESCHGAASQWLEPHVYETWINKSSDEQQAAGMNDTRDWLSRIELCGRCHIGSRSADGLVRDMNHDLIAAGHPALRFDGWLFMENAIPHWSSDDAAPVSNVVRQESAAWLSLSFAARLALERLEAHRANPTTVPWPELSHFDCFACHHDLKINHYRSQMGKLGESDWNPAYVAGLLERRSDNPSLAKLKLDYVSTDRELTTHSKLLQSVMTQARQRATSVAQRSAPADGTTSLSAAIDRGGSLNDWHDASAWYIRVQAALADTDGPGNAALRQGMGKILDHFSQHVLSFGQDLQSPDSFQPVTIDAHSTNSPAYDPKTFPDYRHELRQLIHRK